MHFLTKKSLFLGPHADFSPRTDFGWLGPHKWTKKRSGTRSLNLPPTCICSHLQPFAAICSSLCAIGAQFAAFKDFLWPFVTRIHWPKGTKCCGKGKVFCRKGVRKGSKRYLFCEPFLQERYPFWPFLAPFLQKRLTFSVFLNTDFLIKINAHIEF